MVVISVEFVRNTTHRKRGCFSCPEFGWVLCSRSLLQCRRAFKPPSHRWLRQQFNSTAVLVEIRSHRGLATLPIALKCQVSRLFYLRLRPHHLAHWRWPLGARSSNQSISDPQGMLPMTSFVSAPGFLGTFNQEGSGPPAVQCLPATVPFVERTYFVCRNFTNQSERDSPHPRTALRSGSRVFTNPVQSRCNDSGGKISKPG